MDHHVYLANQRNFSQSNISQRLDTTSDSIVQQTNHLTPSSYPSWNNFFLSAGIPNAVANEYAITFSQHRIKMDMLKEISKEILLDMGIKAMGDIIAILRHAKNLYTQDELKIIPKPTINTNTTATTSINPQNPSSYSRITHKISKDNSISQQQHSHSSMVNNNSNTINNVHHRTTPIMVPASSKRSSSMASNNYKIQSRISLNSGALIASSNNSASSTSQSFSNKRQNSSTLSDTLAKRLKPATDSISGGGGNLPEKTLTVHYPSSAAIAKAQQRILTNNVSLPKSKNNHQISSSSSPLDAINQRIRERNRERNSTSIKSRLGTKKPNVVTNNNNNNKNNHHSYNKNNRRI